VSPNSGGGTTSTGAAQRDHIVQTALSLMGQRGVDGVSMRDLAAAAGLNVASLYHYFASKRDLLVAVLEDRGFISGLAAAGTPTLGATAGTDLSHLLDDILRSMLEVEDFIRLMLGEVLRGDETAFGVGIELFTATQEALERWLAENEPELCAAQGAPAVARMLRALIIGTFFEHVAGVLDDQGDTRSAFKARADEAAALLQPRSPS
jgi:AcrR family transcriptional regulator